MKPSFDKFVALVENTPIEQVSVLTAPLRGEAKKYPTDDDCKRIIEFDSFLSSAIAPSGLSTPNRDFYRRTAERMVRQKIWPADAMVQFGVSPSEFV